jgi:hypothetical protein
MNKIKPTQNYPQQFNMKKRALIFSLFLMVFQIHAQEKKANTPVIVVKLMESEKFKVEDASLHFEKVVSDSRCPSDVTCVWQGEAKIKVSLIKDGKMVEGKELVLANPVQDNTAFTLGKKAFKIYGLMPYPTSKMKSEGKIDYYLQVEYLKEEKPNQPSTSKK